MIMRKARSFILCFILLMVLCVPSFSEEIIAEAKTAMSTKEVFPQLDIAGYKRYLFSSLTINNIAGSDLLPSDAITGGPWQEGLRLIISGKLSRDLDVYYDLEQVNARAEIYNMAISYYDNNIIFGSLNDNYYSDFLLQNSISGVILSKTFGSITPFIAPTAKVYPNYSGSKRLTPLSYGYGSALYFGNELFPAFTNYENNYDKQYWMARIKKYQKYRFTQLPLSYLSAEKDPERAFLIGRTYYGSENVYVDGQKRFRDIDFTVDCSRGDLIFNDGIQAFSEVKADYSATVSTKEYNATSAGLEWELSDDNRVTIGYLSGSSNIPSDANYYIANISQSMNFGDDSEFIWEINTSNTVTSTLPASFIMNTGNAYSASYRSKLGRLSYYIKGSNMESGFASSSLTFLDQTRGYGEIAGLCSYDISGGSITDGAVKLGFSSINEGTGESTSDSAMTAYILESDNTLYGWLGLFNRYQYVEESLQDAPASKDYTNSLSNIVSVNLNHFYPQFDDPSKVYVKYLSEGRHSTYTADLERSNVEVGNLMSFYPFSVLVNHSALNSTVSSITSEVASYVRGTYDFNSNTGVYLDYSVAEGSYTNDYLRNIAGVGVIFDFPQGEGSILSSLYFGVGLRVINYTDKTVPANNYTANEMRLSGTLYF